MLAWLRGERQWYDEAEQRHRQVRLIDFDEPSANVLHVTWEWRLKPPARKGNRADVMFVVNGVPVAIVEHKNPTDDEAIERGITQLRRYEIETPELIGAAQLFNVTHLLDYWYGVTWNLSRRYMARWKETQEESYRFAVQSFFEPTDFPAHAAGLDSLLRRRRRDAQDRAAPTPAPCRGPHRRTLRRAGEAPGPRLAHPRVRQDFHAAHRSPSGPRGQGGSLASPTVVVVVDRTELEGQLAGWVERLLGEMQQQDIAVWRAGSKEQLRELLATDRRGLIISMIHKFEGIEKDANSRDNIYVFIDEAHRSVARELGTYLMAALPNSTIIGFTGTPIDTNGARGGHLQDIRGRRRSGLPGQVFDSGVHRGRDDAAHPPHDGAQRDDRAGGTTRPGVLRPGRDGRCHRRRRAQPCAGPGRGAAHLPFRR